MFGLGRLPETPKQNFMVKSLPLALLVSAGLLSSTAPASAYIIYGDTVVNGVSYNLSPGADLSGANLTDAFLPGAILIDADLTDAILIDADLNHASLYTADLTNAILYNADLSNAILTEAILTFATLRYADLTYANLTDANLFYADLTYATVSYSDWADFSQNSGALYLETLTGDPSLINYAGPAPVPEPSTYGLIGLGALGVAFAARRKKLKTA